MWGFNPTTREFLGILWNAWTSGARSAVTPRPRMGHVRIDQACLECRARLIAYAPPQKAPPDMPLRGLQLRQHLLWMTYEIPRFSQEHPGRARHWLGFLQGALCVDGETSLNSVLAMNRPK